MDIEPVVLLAGSSCGQVKLSDGAPEVALLGKGEKPARFDSFDGGDVSGHTGGQATVGSVR